MALPSDWKIGKFLEWCTELPYINRPRISQTFLFQNTECYFQLKKNGGNKYYYMYLETKNVAAKLTKASFIIYMIYGNDYSRNDVAFVDSNRCILYFYESLFPKQTLDFSQGFFIRFVFMFENTVGPLLPSETKKEDKCVETESHLDVRLSVESLFKDYSELLNSGPNHDVEIMCGDFSMKAHKIILSARSEVLKAMLQCDMVEGRTGMIEMKAMQEPHIQDFIKYLYTGSLPELTFDKAKALYESGDKYAVKCLFLRCSIYLQNNLSPEIACQCLELADIHSDQELKNKVITYIIDKKLYLKDEIWLPFCENHSKLAVEVYRLSYKSA